MTELRNKRREHYDRLVGASRDFDKQAAWLDTLFRQYSAKSVLDCGCGTGTHAILLAEKGYDVTAFDYSKEQIGLAKEKARRHGVDVTFHVADIKDFSLGRFDAVVSLFAPIMFGCRDQADLTKAVTAIKRSLNDGGVALVETPTPRMMDSDGIEVNTHAEEGLKVARVAFYTFRRDEKAADVRYAYAMEKDGEITHDDAEARHAYFDRDDFERAFSTAGAEAVTWYSVFNDEKGLYEPYEEGASGMITPLFK
mgnify:CR=1 FL=1